MAGQPAPQATRPGIRPRQRSFGPLEIPLHEVTFCAVDLETTSGSHRTGEIIEIGAVKARGGEVLGTFETFVQPSSDPPVEIQLLTGITPGMLAGALPLPAVMPSFLEFCGSAVFVAHNARFDRSFVEAACRRLDYDAPEGSIIDTAKLARRLLGHEIRNARLHTLASHFRTPHTPCHRAFADAAACLEVLWALIERAAAYGVSTLADLLEVQSVRSNPHFEKVKLARLLPTTRGVYLFENSRCEVIYVGKAANLRARVRSYFTSDERKRMGDLRAEVASVRVVQCTTELEAAALEARLIERHKPRFNRAGVRRRSPVYLRLTKERHPRLAVSRSIRNDGATYVGPFASTARARAVASTLSGIFGLRTCTLRLGSRPHEPCALYALGSCHGPCTNRDADVCAHDRAVADLRDDLLGGLDRARHRLAGKLHGLAEHRRFEEAAGHRDAFNELARAVDRARRLGALHSAGRVTVELDGNRVELDGGRIVLDGGPETPAEAPADPPCPAPAALSMVDIGERLAVASSLDKADDVRLVACDSPLAYPWPRATPIERLDP